MLNSTYAEQVVQSCENYLGNKDEFIDNMVDSTFSAEVLSDLKEALKETSNLKLLSLNPPAICKLLMSALLNKEYTDLTQLFSSVDLRGLHFRKKNQPEPKEDLPTAKNSKYSYRSNATGYDYLMKKIGGCFQVFKPDDEYVKAIEGGLKKFTYKEGDNALEYVASLPQDNLCLVEISTLIARVMCTLSYETNVECIDKLRNHIRENMEQPFVLPELTYGLMPVGNGFVKTFLKTDKLSISRYYWDRKHTRIWYSLMVAYACSMFRRKINQAEQITKVFDEPFSRGQDYTCYIKHSPNKLHARIFGVFTVADFNTMLTLALKYYDEHHRAFDTIDKTHADIYKIMQIPCVTAHIGTDSVEKCLGFARLYSGLRLW